MAKGPTVSLLLAHRMYIKPHWPSEVRRPLVKTIQVRLKISNFHPRNMIFTCYIAQVR